VVLLEDVFTGLVESFPPLFGLGDIVLCEDAPFACGHEHASLGAWKDLTVFFLVAIGVDVNLFFVECVAFFSFAISEGDETFALVGGEGFVDECLQLGLRKGGEILFSEVDFEVTSHQIPAQPIKEGRRGFQKVWVYLDVFFVDDGFCSFKCGFYVQKRSVSKTRGVDVFPPDTVAISVVAVFVIARFWDFHETVGKLETRLQVVPLGIGDLISNGIKGVTMPLKEVVVCTNDSLFKVLSDGGQDLFEHDVTLPLPGI